MRTVTQEELKIILDNHRKWLLAEVGERTDLSYADLRGANLRYTNLRGANLRYANLRGADLRGANLSDADLDEADLRYADLRGADLRGANLSDADLDEADLRYADLRGANLRYTNLIDANLRYANLIDANLRYANLRGASTQYVQGLTIVSVDNIGTYKGKATFIPKYNVVFAGCWSGDLEKFLEKGLEMNEEDELQLKNIKLAYEFFKLHKDVETKETTDNNS